MRWELWVDSCKDFVEHICGADFGSEASKYSRTVINGAGQSKKKDFVEHIFFGFLVDTVSFVGIRCMLWQSVWRMQLDLVVLHTVHKSRACVQIHPMQGLG